MKKLILIISVIASIFIGNVYAKEITIEEYEKYNIKRSYVVCDYIFDIDKYNPTLKDLLIAGQSCDTKDITIYEIKITEDINGKIVKSYKELLSNKVETNFPKLDVKYIYTSSVSNSNGKTVIDSSSLNYNHDIKTISLNEEGFNQLSLNRSYIVGGYIFDIESNNPTLKDLMIANQTNTIGEATIYEIMTSKNINDEVITTYRELLSNTSLKKFPNLDVRYVYKSNIIPEDESKENKIILYNEDENELSVTITGDGTYKYNGKERSISITANEGAVIKYGTKSGNYNLDTSPKYKDAGTYTIYYQVTKTGYKTVTGSVVITIEKADLTENDIIVNAYKGTYDGKTHQATIKTTISGLKIVSGDSVSYGTTIIDNTVANTIYSLSPALTNVGVKTVYYKVTGSNYNDYIGTTTITIEKADLTENDIIVNAYKGTYDGKVHQATIKTTITGLKIVSGDSASYGTTISDNTVANTAYSLSPALTNAGEKTVYYKVTGSNYNDYIGTTTVTIEKADLTITAKNQTIDYGGSIATTTSYAILSGSVSNQTLSSISLLANTTSPTKSGIITISSATIKDSNNNDVTSNYNISYVAGTLIINPPANQTIDSFDNYSETIVMEDLSSYGIHNPNLSSINTEVEDTGMIATFDGDDVGGYAWAQRYLFTTNIKDKISLYSDFMDEYYIRIWIAEENLKRFGISLYLSDGTNEYYVDPAKVILIDSYGNTLTRETDYTNYEFYQDTHVLLPDKFHGWVNFPLSAVKNSSNANVDLTTINKLILDIRPEEPRKGTFYTLDNFVITNTTMGDSYNNTYEIDYRNDLIGIKYSNWYDFWQSPAGNGSGSEYIYNITNILNGTGGSWDSLPQNMFYYWAEPALGYYKSSDESVIRTHMQQLSDANVDFIFIDLTNLGPNSDTYYEQWIWPYQVSIPTTSILDTMINMREEGLSIPHVVFWVGTFNTFGIYNDDGNQYVMNRVYNEYINNSKYKDLFVYYGGKPLVIGTNNIDQSKIEANVTYRYMWALQESISEIDNGEWTNRILPGSDIYGKDLNGQIEEMPINVAYSAYYMSLGAQSPSADGRYYHSGNSTPIVIGREGGKTFYSSWQQAFIRHPKILMVSSWNEWGAQRLTDTNAPCQDKCFTDQYNMEFSEDIEPMKDGFTDQYYRWMIEYIKNYKAHNSCPTTLHE